MERVANQAASSAHKPRQAPCRCRSNRILAPQKGALARPLYTFASQGHRRFQVYSHQYPACSVAGRGFGRFNDASLRHRQLTAKKNQLGETQPQKKTKKKKKNGKKRRKKKRKKKPTQLQPTPCFERVPELVVFIVMTRQSSANDHSQP